MRICASLAALSLLDVALGELTRSEDCDCYRIDGPDAGYFQHRLFWDFRNVPDDGGNTYTVAPDIVGDAEATGEEPATSAYLDSAEWNANWTYLSGPTDSSNNPYPYVYSKQNVYISRNSTDDAGGSSATYLTMRAARKEGFVSVSQIVTTQKDILHASIRARMRVIPNGLGNASAPTAGAQAVEDAGAGSSGSHPVDAGAVVGLFLYESETQETDIEILTRDGTTQVRYSNQPDFNAASDQPVPGASTQATLPGGLEYTDWVEHRLDWLGGVVRWWAAGTPVLEKTVNAPSQPMSLNLNIWSNGDDYWSGNMSIGAQVNVGIEWIEMVYNTSADAKSAANVGRGVPHPVLFMVGVIFLQLWLFGSCLSLF
jgi:hypothetical protein